MFLFIVLGILEVIHCVLVESPEALNIIKEEHITSIISLLDKHGRNHKVHLLICMHMCQNQWLLLVFQGGEAHFWHQNKICTFIRQANANECHSRSLDFSYKICKWMAWTKLKNAMLSIPCQSQRDSAFRWILQSHAGHRFSLVIFRCWLFWDFYIILTLE